MSKLVLFVQHLLTVCVHMQVKLEEIYILECSGEEIHVKQMNNA